MKCLHLTLLTVAAAAGADRQPAAAAVPAGHTIDLVIENGRVIDATGMAVAPGFIDIHSGITNAFVRGDSRVVGTVTQGVTTEIFGENSTPAPLSAAMLRRSLASLDPADTASRRLLELSKDVENADKMYVGLRTPGMFADVVVFNPNTIIDQATFEDPVQASIGVRDVFVNGVAVLRDGKDTGAKPGHIVRGPGFKSAASR